MTTTENKTLLPTALAQEIWGVKYSGEYDDPEQFFKDLARRVSLGSHALEERFRTLMLDLRFAAGGRILAWNGRAESKVSLMNCTTHAVNGDSLNEIANAMHVIMLASSHGQGIGLDLSKLRPQGAPVDNAAKTSTGAISFMELLSHVGGTIGQNGRRAALLFSMRDNHPDLWRDSIDIPCPKCGGKGCFMCLGKGGYSYDFLNVKRVPGKVENANISVMVTDAFMEAVQQDADWALSFEGESGDAPFHVERTVRARDLFRALAQGAWSSAEPGVLFWDTSKRMSNSDLFGEKYGITGVNACVHGDTYVKTENGSYKVRELAEMSEPPSLMVYDEAANEMVFEKPLWIRKTRKNAQVMSINAMGWDLVLTPDHKVLTGDGRWVEAQHLSLSDSIRVYNDGDNEPDVVRLLTIQNVNEHADVYDVSMPTHHNFVAEGIVVHNCSEQVLDQDGVCNLGSMNLARYVIEPFTSKARFDYTQLSWDVMTAIHFLDNVLEIELADDRSITETQRESIIALRRIGLGVMGLADAITMMGLRYEASEETAKFVRAVFSTIRNAAYEKSIMLAQQSGACGVWKSATKEQRKELVNQGFYDTLPLYYKKQIIEHGLRNAVLLSIAPTGSISNLFGVSSGVEPIFAREYTRRLRISGKDEIVTYVHPGVKMSREAGLDDSVWQTAYEVSPKDHVLVQGWIQPYVDASISKTVNMPFNATVEDVEAVYMLAWEEGLKGVTVYRDGSRDTQILESLDRANGEGVDPNACPQCGGQLVKQEGCTSCPSCGFSKCG